MDSEQTIAPQDSSRWFIDLDWYQKNKRSFAAMAEKSLCAKCAKRIRKKESPSSTEELMKSIKGCCSESRDFIHSKVPILESVFRLFLANGNQPLSLEELHQQLSERLSGDSYRTSPEILGRLLPHDHYYGFGQYKD